VQVLSHVLCNGHDPQSALDQPRICLEPADHDGDAERPAAMQLPAARSRTGLRLCVEEGVPEAELQKLRSLGHTVVGHLSGRARATFGRGQMIVVVRDEKAAEEGVAAAATKRGGGEQPSAEARRILWAGSDGRGDGCAMGW
jgi:gamma-glutamyltranspeptidase/glutathione hydrolase